MKDEEAVEVLRRTIRCYTGSPTFCPVSDCLQCELFEGKDKLAPALMLAVQALEGRMREPPEVVFCRDCALEGTIHCRFTQIEKARLIFMDRPMTWFCADGVRKET